MPGNVSRSLSILTPRVPPTPTAAPAAAPRTPEHPVTRRLPAPPPPAADLGPGRAGFVLYVGVDPDRPGAPHPADLAEVAEALRDLARDLLPAAETFTALSLVPRTGQADEAQTLRARLAHLRPLDGGEAAPPVAETA